MSAPGTERRDARETRVLVEFWCGCGERAVYDGNGGEWCQLCLSSDDLRRVTVLCEVVARSESA